MIKQIKANLKELGFKENEIKVYVVLTQMGEAPASKIAKRADLPRTTVISILERLKDEGYLTTHIYRGLTYYWVESPAVLAAVFKNRVAVAEDMHRLLSDLYRSKTHFPIARVYDTKAGIKQFIEKVLAGLERKAVIYTIDTPEMGNYAKIFSDNIGGAFINQKKKKDILTNTLVPAGSFREIAGYKVKSQNIKIRELPEGISFKSSLWIIGDSVVHFSGRPPFLVSIEHELVTPSIKSIFDFLWGISVPKN